MSQQALDVFTSNMMLYVLLSVSVLSVHVYKSHSIHLT